jgi:CBS domain-containing protein
MLTVQQLLREKANQEVFTLPPDATIYRALELMAEKDIGGVLVVKNGKVVGIFTERDYARRIILRGKCSLDMLLEEIMTPTVISVGPEHTIEDCMQIITNRRTRYLPVMVDDQLLGLLTIGDVMAAIIAHKDDTINRLEDYILGEGYAH